MTPIDNTMPRHHFSKILYFPEPPGSDPCDAVNAFRDGLSKTLEAIAPLSGTMQVIGRRGGLGVTGPWNMVDDILHIKDLRQDPQLEYQSLKDKHFPTNALDRNLFYPVVDLTSDVKKVMVVQLTMIKGGIIMLLCLHYCFTDGSGTMAIARVWAEYCREEDGSQLITPEMLNREPLIRGWGSATLADTPQYVSVPVKEKVPAGGILNYIHTNFLGPLIARLSK